MILQNQIHVESYSVIPGYPKCVVTLNLNFFSQIHKTSLANFNIHTSSRPSNYGLFMRLLLPYIFSLVHKPFLHRSIADTYFIRPTHIEKSSRNQKFKNVVRWFILQVWIILTVYEQFHLWKSFSTWAENSTLVKFTLYIPKLFSIFIITRNKTISMQMMCLLDNKHMIVIHNSIIA